MSKVKILGVSCVEPRIRPFMLRCGVAYVMSGIVEVSSLGKMFTDWRMTAVKMAEEKHELRKFLERVANQRPRRAHHGDRAYATVAGAIAIAQGSMEILSLGRLTADWTMQWMCFGEEIIEWMEI